MKKTKARLFILVILLILFIIAVIVLFTMDNGKTNAFDTNVTVYGYVKDEDGNSKADIEVKLTDGTNNYTAKTNENGVYSLRIPTGNYVAEFDYSNLSEQFCAKQILWQEYARYDENLEIAILYNENINIQSLEERINELVNLGNEIRIIKNSYSNNEELKNDINQLKMNTENEMAFHKVGKQNWRSVAIILTSLTEREVIEYTTLKGFSPFNYKFVVKGIGTSISSIMGSLYTKLGMEISEASNVLESMNNQNCKTSIISINSSSTINLILKKQNSAAENFNNNFPNCIQGNISAEGIPVQNAIVKLIKAETEEEIGEVFTTQNGDYSFAAPVELGKYKLKFIFSQTNINGQYYEVEQNYKKVGETSNPQENCISRTNVENKNNQFNNQYIKYKEEEIFNNNTDEKCTLTCVSDEFLISNPSLQLYGGVKLKEREKFVLNVKEEVNSAKIVLNDGQVIEDWKSENNSNSGIINSNGQGGIVLTLDDELRHGATIYVEYKIQVINNGNMDCTGFTILNRTNLQYIANEKFLSREETNKDMNWEIIKSSEANNLIGNTENSEKEITYIKLNYDRSLPAGTYMEFYLVVSGSLRGENTETNYTNTCEIVQYKNNEGRRNYQNKTEEKLSQAGNLWQGKIEADTGRAEKIMVLPPFGVNKN